MRNAMMLWMVSGALMAQVPGGTGPRTLDQLKEFYQSACAGCHGPDGAARSAEGKKLKGRDFTDPKENTNSDATMVKTIRKGIFFGKVMPAFREQLSEAEAALIVAEIVRKAEKGRAIVPLSTPPK